MDSWQSGDVEANGIRLHYTRTGGSKPPVVLAHGITDDGLCWTPVAEALASEYDVIMVDARGHGRSDAPANGYDLATLAADLAGVITVLGLERPAILGHSMGAGTTLVLAGTFPELPGAILLEDPPGWWMAAADAPGAAARQAQMREWIAGFKRKTAAELIAEQRAAAPGWSEAELVPWAAAKLRVSPNILGIFSPQRASVDWPATLRRIRCPALLITGDPAQGAILTEEGVAALQALVPQLRVAHIAGAGHSIRRDQFERYIDVVRMFLRDELGLHRNAT